MFFLKSLRKNLIFWIYKSDIMSREIKELTPQQYFDAVKDAKKKITDEELARVYDNCLELINKYKITGQNSAIKKCIFHLDSVEREREIVKMGINTFVYRDDIEYYINDVASDVVKIIELERYEREIPDEIVNMKMEQNEAKYPVEKAKGSAAKYDQL